MHVNNAGITRQNMTVCGKQQSPKNKQKQKKHELKVQIYGKLISFYN